VAGAHDSSVETLRASRTRRDFLRNERRISMPLQRSFLPPASGLIRPATPPWDPLGGSARGNVAREQRYHEQEQRRHDERHRIERAHAVEQPLHRRAAMDRKYDAGHDTRTRQRHAAHENQPEHVTRLRAQGHPQADFTGALPHDVGQEAVDPNRREQQRQTSNPIPGCEKRRVPRMRPSPATSSGCCRSAARIDALECLTDLAPAWPRSVVRSAHAELPAARLENRAYTCGTSVTSSRRS